MCSYYRIAIIICITLFSTETLADNQIFKTSFDCAKASSEIEKMICHVNDLASQDIELNSIYRSLIASLPQNDKNQLKKTQVDWLLDRNRKCSSLTNMKDCLENSYQARFEVLEKTWKQLKPVLPSGGSVKALADVTIPLIYASDNYYGEYTRMLISKHRDEVIPIFGVKSHFYPYEGTPINIKQISKPLYVTYIGMRIKNRQLVDEFNVQFKQYVKFDADDAGDETGFIQNLLDRIFQKAYACGPYFGYTLVGDSQLDYLYENNGISWFKMVTPFDLSLGATMMQLYYSSNHAQGVLSVELASMLLIDNYGNYYSPTFNKGGDITGDELNFYHDSIPVRNSYEACFGDDEKGNIEVKQNSRNMLIELTFKNTGIDPITIDQQSLFEIEAQLVTMSEGKMGRELKSINVYNVDGTLLASLPFDEIKSNLQGKRISPGDMISIPITRSSLPKDNLYFISATARKSTVPRKRNTAEGDKLIYWKLGSSPYRYFSPGKDVSPIYLVYINQDSSADIDEINNVYSFSYPATQNSFFYKETGLRSPLKRNLYQHVSTLLNKAYDFSWAEVVPKDEIASYVKHIDSADGSIRSYSGGIIEKYRRANFHCYVSTGTLDDRDVGVIYELPDKWMNNRKLSQYLLWMIKENPL